MVESRNNTLGFVQRTRKNLELVRHYYDKHKCQSDHEKYPCQEEYPFHPVAHSVNSLLGLVVFPLEGHLPDSPNVIHLLDVDLTALKVCGRPIWKKIINDCSKCNSNTVNLNHFLCHLRNATAHGRFEFIGNADSHELANVTLQVSDAKKVNSDEWKVYWTYEINGQDLYEFCLLLAKKIEGALD